MAVVKRKVVSDRPRYDEDDDYRRPMKLRKPRRDYSDNDDGRRPMKLNPRYDYADDDDDNSVTIDVKDKKLTMKGSFNDFKNLDVHYDDKKVDSKLVDYIISQAISQARFHPRGTYYEDTQYNSMDVVSFKNCMYVCIDNNVMGVDPDNRHYWRLLLGTNDAIPERMRHLASSSCVIVTETSVDKTLDDSVNFNGIVVEVLD